MSADKISQRELRKAEELGYSPVEFLLNVMNNEHEPMGRRVEAAKAAAPFIHPRLSAVDSTHDLASHEEALKELS